MVKMITAEDRLVEELFSKNAGKDRCPFINRDEEGPYCGKSLSKGGEIGERKRIVCDVGSLQLWCLSENYKRCIFYRAKN